MTPEQTKRANAIANREPYPANWTEDVERAREIVRECGDLPEALAHAMCMRAPTGIKPLEVIDELRGPNAADYPETGRI